MPPATSFYALKGVNTISKETGEMTARVSLLSCPHSQKAITGLETRWEGQEMGRKAFAAFRENSKLKEHLEEIGATSQGLEVG